MKAILLITLLVCSTLGTTFHKMSSFEAKKFEDMKQNGKWSSIIMNLVELHLQAQGPFDQLTAAIQVVIDDVAAKLDSVNLDFDHTTSEHNNQVKFFEGVITHAQLEIATTTSFLENVLYPNKLNLQQTIAELKTNIQNTQADIENYTASRQLAHTQYEERVVEHNDAIAAIEEAVQLLGTLRGDSISLAEVKNAQILLQKVQKKLQNNVETEFIKALLTLSTSQFTNQEDLNRVVELLYKLKENISNSQIKEAQEEEEAQTAFDQQIKEWKSDIVRMTNSVAENTEELAKCEEAIANALTYIDVEKYEQKQAEDDLVAENEAFQRATDFYNDMVAQLNSEIQACNDGLEILATSDVAGYIGNRVSQDTMIDQYHGQGVAVADWSV